MKKEKKIALVTGAGSGIGWATARLLHDEGIYVIICDNSNENIDLANSKITDKNYNNMSTIYADVSSEADIIQLFNQIKQNFGQLDYLVNNAGIDSFCDSQSFSTLKYNHVMAVNVTSVFLAIREAIPLMRNSKVASIVNIGSIHGEVTTAGRSDYATSKTALIGATRALSLDLAPEKIRVNMVSPGAIDTPMLLRGWKEKVSNMTLNEVRRKAEAIHPCGRIGQPEDIANAVSFLLSEKATFINGVNLKVDGGIHSKVFLSTIWDH
jgi:NAD(P)-dependent dehydrogenase (short-subunit alcohol dehydrogenase family)